MSEPALDLMVFADIICPWCYVGKRRLEKALETVDAGTTIRVTWLPFELNPDMPGEGMERSAYRMRKFGSLQRSQHLDAQLTELGAQEGLGFRYDLMTRTPNTLSAHRLIMLAAQGAGQGALIEALFRAYFVLGRDVGDLETLVEIGSTVSMDPARVRMFLQGEEGTLEVRKYEEAARNAGITGVPAFIANRRPLFMGAQPPDVIAAALQNVLAHSSAA
jgi:predicted DsbA family dithiol-disulfide isomerase